MRQYLCYMSPWGAMKMHPLGECAMDLSSLGLRPRDDLDPLPIHPRDAISLHPSGSCSKNIMTILCEEFRIVGSFEKNSSRAPLLAVLEELAAASSFF